MFQDADVSKQSIFDALVEWHDSLRDRMKTHTFSDQKGNRFDSNYYNYYIARYVWLHGLSVS